MNKIIVILLGVVFLGAILFYFRDAVNDWLTSL